jgi:hypothetical protein
VFGQVNWAGPLPGSRPTWYLTHEYLGRDQNCDLQELQVTPLTVPLFFEGRHSLLTHEAEDGTSTPMLLARSRHASVRSLKRYARPGPEAVARHVARTDPAARRRRPHASDPAPLPGRDPNRCFFAG